jgi:hypothetical protein
MDWIEPESFGLFCPHFADELVGGQALQGLQASPVIVGVDEDRQVSVELLVAVVVVAFDGGFLDGSVHPFDLPVGPGMLHLCQPVLDAVRAASHVEHVRHVARRWAAGVAWREGELDAVVGQDGVDLVGERLDHPFQEGRRRGSSGLLDQLHNGEFARSVNSDIEIELAFGGLDLGDIDVEIADRIDLEPLLGGLVAFDLWPPRDAVTRQAAMQ